MPASVGDATALALLHCPEPLVCTTVQEKAISCCKHPDVLALKLMRPIQGTAKFFRKKGWRDIDQTKMAVQRGANQSP
jgi:hypothetical protein